MHLHFERTVNSKSDCPILSLTWMGKVPDELPEDEGWKLNRNNYYQEGWLATGNVRGIVGVTFTTSHCKKNIEFPARTNYNLRGHRSEVILVKWNEPYQKLASCDSSGIIFVWIKYEGRWSIELINDRNTPVTCFSWSHDGRMALICYQDGFVLVGSVAGQRYWSSMLNLEGTITCGIWTPDDLQVYLGTTSGQIIVMDVHGAMVSQVQLTSEVGITSMSWSCEKFKMEEEDECTGLLFSDKTYLLYDRKYILAVALQNGIIYLLNTFDDVSPIQINTGLQGPLCIEWSNSREFLAVSGATIRTSPIGPQLEYTNTLRFYNEKGSILYSTIIPEKNTRVSTMTWGHNDKRLFLATGTQIHIAWISRRVASLQLLSRLCIHNLIPIENKLILLPLPMRLRNIIGNLFAQTIRCCIPEPNALREFVSRPPVGSIRLHCTMIRHDEESNLSSGTCYTLYLEYLGGLVPLLKGKRTSKIRPEFVIFDPQDLQLHLPNDSSKVATIRNLNVGLSDSSDTEREDWCTGSPKLQKRRKRKNKLSQYEKHYYKPDIDPDQEELTYVDTLPEQVRLVEVTSNIWGTKFKIHGLDSTVPANLGQITYKTSLLHLQPRQMTLVMTELGDDFLIEPDPTFNPNLFSEDEEESPPIDQESNIARVSLDNCPPIAPMSPRGNILNKQKCYLQENENDILNKLDYYGERNSYVEINDERFRPQTTDCTNSTQSNFRPNSNTQNTSFVSQFKNSNQYCSNQRHAISPMCCEVSVPALQSPKNAVAPSDIIFDRPPVPTIVSYSNDFFGNTINGVYVKPNYINDHTLNDISVTFNLNKDKQKPIIIKKRDGENPQNLLSKENDKTQNVMPIVSKELPFKREDENLLPSTCKNIPATFIVDPIVRSCSVGYLDMVEAQLVPSDASILLLRKDIPKRLVLVNKKQKTRRQCRLSSKQTQAENNNNKINPKLKLSGKSKSLDSSDIFFNVDPNNIPSHNENVLIEIPILKENSKIHTSIADVDIPCNNSPKINTKKEIFSKVKPERSNILNLKKKKLKDNTNQQTINSKSNASVHTPALSNLEKFISKLKEDDKVVLPSAVQRLPRSSPSSPAPSKKGIRPRSSSPIRRRLLNSPLLGRKYRKSKYLESSDDEVNASGDEIYTGKNYKDLETFQKSQLKQKLKRGKIEPNGSSNYKVLPQRREFVMHNKAPMWNENSQVYQLDFGGRVTQESAKNFQIEFRGKQVMQFGRIDGNAYTLDFQYPFSALQAFAVALANVTQRLK